MSEFNIEVQDGSSVRLPTAGKYCDRDIIVTASGGGGGTEEIENLIDESGVLDSTDGTATEKVKQIVDWLSFFTRDIKGVSMATCKGNCIKETPVIDCTNYIYLSNAFAETSRVANGINVGLEVVRLKNTQNITHWAGTFSNARALHTIEILDFSSCASALSGTFEYCTSLINLKFALQTIKRSISFVHCSKLSVESRQSIFDGLATVTTAQTLTLNPQLKILQSQVDSANAKGWTVAGGTVVSEEEYYA